MRKLAFAWALAVCTTARAQDDPEPPPAAPPAGEVVNVTERAPPEAASSAHLTEEDLERRPHTTSSDLLRAVPGLVVGQHAGGGKADQYFLRGFDADHGTDVAVFVDGVPVNLTSHGHGQGYADTHWLIPELVTRIDVHKGPYSARFGDFYTAGAVEMTTIDEAPFTLLATLGTELDGPRSFEDPIVKLVALGSPKLSGDTKALLAGEVWYTNGPFENPQGFRRSNLFGKVKTPLGSGELSLAATFYAASWHASGQIPLRAVEAGLLDRFGHIDPTEGGDSTRGSLSAMWRAPELRLQLYAVDYRLRLFSNFTFFARDPDNGDGIEQTDARTIYGATGAWIRSHPYGILTAGFQARFDNVKTELWHQAQRARLPDCFDSGPNPCFQTQNRIADVAAFAEDDLLPLSWLRVQAGLRYDLFVWDVDDLTNRGGGGTSHVAIISPKISVVFLPHEMIDVFVNSGFGFHSNDARAAVTAGDEALATAKGAEVGVRVRPVAGLEATIAAWYLHLSSEQVWNGDAGGTEASDPSERIGLDVAFTWEPTPWLALDASIALARPQSRPNEGNGGAIALAPKLMGSGGVAVHNKTSTVSLRARGIGPRPANDDETLTADGYLVLDLVASHAEGPWRFGITAVNLLNSAWRETQFGDPSRLPNEPEPVEDIHFTPGVPLQVLGTVGFVWE